ncbi:MAG: 2-hydroxyacid dehydrogenase [Hyphomicrobiales bacterium]|nr:2-hydroxyacid dehydrogenase [Hyphomicrobiales bacterium]MDE2016933.1 2-hydroxyacid dehydrogenase [Hyphomicrobiales bacterium]
MARRMKVLAMTAPMAIVTEELGARHDLVKLWETPAAEREAALAAVAPRVEAIAAGGGHGAIDDALFARLPKLEIVSSFGVGYDHVDAKAAARRGIVVTHTPGVLDEEVADTAMALMLGATRRLPAAERWLRAGKWKSVGPFPLTASLRGRTLGILGFGRIGKAIARRAEAHGLMIAYCNRRPVEGVAYPYHPTPVALAAACDVLCAVMPGGAATKGIVNEDVFKALGPDGVFVNVGRGSSVDEPALVEALATGAILAAGLDVFAHEPDVPEALLALDNVMLLPHVASASHATREAMAKLVIANLDAWAEGRGPLTPVPETPWPRG